MVCGAAVVAFELAAAVVAWKNKERNGQTKEHLEKRKDGDGPDGLIQYFIRHICSLSCCLI